MERLRERSSDTETETETERDRERQRDRETERQRGKQHTHTLSLLLVLWISTPLCKMRFCSYVVCELYTLKNPLKQTVERKTETPLLHTNIPPPPLLSRSKNTNKTPPQTEAAAMDVKEVFELYDAEGEVCTCVLSRLDFFFCCCCCWFACLTKRTQTGAVVASVSVCPLCVDACFTFFFLLLLLLFL